MGFSNFGPFLHIGREPNTQQEGLSRQFGKNIYKNATVTLLMETERPCRRSHLSDAATTSDGITSTSLGGSRQRDGNALTTLAID